METLLIGLKNEKARQLLTNLAALDLIEIQEQEIVKPSTKLFELRHKISNRMGEKQIDAQLQKLRHEWQRNI